MIMKNRLLLIGWLLAGNLLATPSIHEALKNPSIVTVLQLNGTADEAKLLTKNASKFTSLNAVFISGISDSILAEQDFIAVASCVGVNKVSISNCGISHLSGAIKMLVSVNEMEISDCKNLEAGSVFTSLAGMPSLKSVSYATAKLTRIPKSFVLMRGLQKISIHNTDLSLADGYALNNSTRKSLTTKESLQLGFGETSLVLEYSCFDKISAIEHIGIMRDMLQGAAGMNDEMILPQRPSAFTRENPLVKPPISGLDIFKNVYSTNSKTGGLIEYPSGTKILIPGNAFVDANGNAVNGNVTIDYREFRDPVDILVSGIPMVYDSAGQKGDFQSEGMFELNASVNGKEVFLAPGKKVDLEFSVVDTASTYNFYRLDPNAGWVYQNTTGKVETKDVPVTAPTTRSAGNSNLVYSAAASDFLWRTRSSYRKKPSLRDTTSFERIYQDTDYFYTTNQKEITKLSGKKEFKTATRWRMERAGYSKGTFCFYLTNHYKSTVYRGNNPEMSVYRNVMWKLNDKLDKKTLRSLKSASSGVNDLRIKYEGDSVFSIEIKSPDGFATISATPVYTVYGGERKAISERRCRQMDKQYNKILQGRKRGFTNAIRHRVYMNSRWEIRLHQDSLKQWAREKKDMNATELSMDFPSWVNYAKRNAGFNPNPGALSEEASTQSGAVYQALSILKFGVYNCDQIRRINNPVQVYALAYSPDNIPQNASQLFIIEKNRNQVFSYSGFAGDPIQIAFGKFVENKMIVVNADGSVAMTDEKQFREGKQTPQGNTRYESVRMSDKPVTTQELREFIYPEKEQQ
jgi:hypothetical protein